MDSKRVIVPLDFPDATRALAMATRLDPALCRVKVGKELFVAEGPAIVHRLHDAGFEVFLDLKFHDIPNTVAGACRAAARLGVWMVNVHATGGEAMLEAAREAVGSAARPPLLIAVTVLTSLTDAELSAVGLSGSAADNVDRLAALTARCGLDGVVCSPLEARALKARHGEAFKLVTPGIRLPDSPADDQRRVLTPAEAAREGADYLVVGRPITQAPDPVAALRAIGAQLAEARP